MSAIACWDCSRYAGEQPRLDRGRGRGRAGCRAASSVSVQRRQRRARGCREDHAGGSAAPPRGRATICSCDRIARWERPTECAISAICSACASTPRRSRPVSAQPPPRSGGAQAAERAVPAQVPARPPSSRPSSGPTRSDALRVGELHLDVLEVPGCAPPPRQRILHTRSGSVGRAATGPGASAAGAGVTSAAQPQREQSGARQSRGEDRGPARHPPARRSGGQREHGARSGDGSSAERGAALGRPSRQGAIERTVAPVPTVICIVWVMLLLSVPTPGGGVWTQGLAGGVPASRDISRPGQARFVYQARSLAVPGDRRRSPREETTMRASHHPGRYRRDPGCLVSGYARPRRCRSARPARRCPRL